ncbi:MAG: preprotein translocase subunit SecG [Bacteroidales bacterium]|nr:preprotein translocase subunit SecG [Bacteroidales bacterium]
MYTVTIILIIVVCILLAIVVLVQNSKGGGLAANFAAPNQIMGVRKTTDFIEKATWTLAALLVVLSIVATATIPSRSEENLKNHVTIENTLPQNVNPVQNATQPAAETNAPAE